MGPLVLTYHQVSPGSIGPYNITPERFAQDMASFHADGWTTVGTATYLRWLEGLVELPPRTMMLTFDDGTSGNWIFVDPVLRRYGYRAVAFVVTGFIGHGDYYMTWPELRELSSTGRWDIESHGHAGHSYVAADQQGTGAPWLINRRWRGDTVESVEDFRWRVDRDFTRSFNILHDQGFDRPRMFAYPFGSDTLPSNDPDGAAYTAGLVRDLFEAAMTENVEVYPSGMPHPQHVVRLGIRSDIELRSSLARQRPVHGPQPPAT